MQTKAKYGERLDQIVFREYKTLDYFEKVLEANPKIVFHSLPILFNGTVDIVSIHRHHRIHS